MSETKRKPKLPETPFNWNCPYCGQATTITSVNHDAGSTSLDVSAKERTDYTFQVSATKCPNADCGKVQIDAALFENGMVKHGDGFQSWRPKDQINQWALLPRSQAKPMPEYVPEEIRSNYEEACLIQKDSPKASAAMSRRCLQGIVRDFWDIPAAKRGKLGTEISYIQDRIDVDTFNSIKAVREVGDIGAHMEKSVDTIVDVEPEEATLLIELIETLISDWYVAKHRRANRNKALQQTVAAKRTAKKIAKDNLKQIEVEADNDDLD